MLSGQGFNTDRLSRDLNAINIKTTFEPLEPLVETDLDGYLKHEQDMIVLTAIEESKKEVNNRYLLATPKEKYSILWMLWNA